MADGIGTGGFIRFRRLGELLDQGLPGAGKAPPLAETGQPVLGKPEQAVIVGTPQGETLNGTADADTITGGAGHDTLRGEASDDSIDGGTGNDLIQGGDRDDFLYGSEGDDVIFGGEGRDIISGGDSDDTLRGENGDDQIWGGAGIITRWAQRQPDHPNRAAAKIASTAEEIAATTWRSSKSNDNALPIFHALLRTRAKTRETRKKLTAIG